MVSVPWTCLVLLNPSELLTGISAACYMKSHIILFHLAFILPPFCFQSCPLVLVLEGITNNSFLATCSFPILTLQISVIFPISIISFSRWRCPSFLTPSFELAFDPTANLWKGWRFSNSFPSFLRGETITEYTIQNVRDPWIYRMTFI